MELTNKAVELEARPVAPQPVLEGPLGALLVSGTTIDVRGSRFLSMGIRGSTQEPNGGLPEACQTRRGVPG
jgi:hypothetical protein